MSLFVECADEAEMGAAFQRLSAGGAVLIPPGNYGFSAKFSWVQDRFGVSWQLNLQCLSDPVPQHAACSPTWRPTAPARKMPADTEARGPQVWT